MRTIARYFVFEFVLTSTAVFLGLTAMWFAADVLLHIDDLAGHFGVGLREVALRYMPVLPIQLPLSGLAGAVLCLTRAVKNRELTAIRTGGIRLQRALSPIIVVSALLAIGLGVLQDRVLLPLRITLERGRADASNDHGRSPERMMDRWWYASGDSIFSASTYEPQTRSMQDVTVFLFDEMRNIRQRIEAKSAAGLDGDTWEIRDAHVLDFSDADKIEIHDTNALRLDLGITTAEMSRAAEPAATASLHELARQIRRTARTSADLAKLELAFHGRIAQPLAVLIVVLLAIPFATGDAGSRDDSLPRALLRSLLAAFLFWLCWTLALLSARSGAVSARISVWGVTVVALAIGAWRYRSIPE
ncbi:MAG TPA: LptF/LptG family permease [Myxococcota bacterium]|nr:LptF/LptG family permease [Myxococcota bacterium]